MDRQIVCLFDGEWSGLVAGEIPEESEQVNSEGSISLVT